MATIDARPCWSCATSIQSRHFSLSRRVEQIELGGAPEKPSKTCHVLSDTILADFCSSACWHEGEGEIATIFVLNKTYPAFNIVALCCSCGKAIDRMKPYVSLSISDLEETSKPWMISAKVHDDREFAALCHECSPTLEGKVHSTTRKRDTQPA